MLKYRNVFQLFKSPLISLYDTKVFSKYLSSNKFSEQAETKRNGNKELKNLPTLREGFESISDKSKDTFLDMVKIFENKSISRRSHVEFIYTALKNMESFGVHTDIEVYKALINVMPKGKFIPTNIFQAEFMHYPKQQQCIIDLLEQMEDCGVIPDYEMEAMLLNIFGRRGHPLRKYWRMMYWMPKFKNLSPWPLPNPVPNEALELAILAVERMCSVDLLSKVEIYNSGDIPEAVDDTWIVSGISKDQSELLKSHDKQKPLYIEGPFLIWLRNKRVNYFTLRGDPDEEFFKKLETIENEKNPDDIQDINIPFFGLPPINKSRQISTLKRSVHQQEEGTIFGICATGTSTKDSLLSWIRLLEKNGNPVLGQIPILFRFHSKIDTTLVPVSKTENITDKNNEKR
ncbi:evolutionarily conserved signaling intermediate in Toll pathway, mitochondrial [Condylostylus longicornis]|uniref:evolutionarily conserved signaling intermediate in Toll pathway, mitochondrial n=1 Tax=Condylostylus longicornis TaxID=2530218 RepID=UPI00244DF721|nr:evolutionarily conserved signaling intermediate in Toll pathway, mitochondrial [Condylostylus longicornis]